MALSAARPRGVTAASMEMSGRSKDSYFSVCGRTREERASANWFSLGGFDNATATALVLPRIIADGYIPPERSFAIVPFPLIGLGIIIKY